MIAPTILWSNKGAEDLLGASQALTGSRLADWFSQPDHVHEILRAVAVPIAQPARVAARVGANTEEIYITVATPFAPAGIRAISPQAPGKPVPRR